MIRQTYTVSETSTLLGIGRNAAYEAVRRGEIPSIKLGRRLLIPKAVVARMLELDDSPNEKTLEAVGAAPGSKANSPRKKEIRREGLYTD